MIKLVNGASGEDVMVIEKTETEKEDVNKSQDWTVISQSRLLLMVFSPCGFPDSQISNFVTVICWLENID